MNQLRNAFAAPSILGGPFCLHKFSILDALHKTPQSPNGIKGLTPPPGAFQMIKEVKYISKV